jgi:aubergine-like protein
MIYDISFDRNPGNLEFLFNKRKIKLVDYYREVYNIKIKDLKQPLLIVKGNLPQGKNKDMYFVPELCKLCGIDDNITKNGIFMKNLSKKTKFTPKERIEKTNDFLSFLKNEERDPEDKTKQSAKEKAELYGIEIKALENKVYGCYMEKPKLKCASDKLKSKEKKDFDPEKNDRFQVLRAKDMKKWVLIYRKWNKKDDNDKYLVDNLKLASKDYGFSIGNPIKGELEDDEGIDDWLNLAEEMVKKEKPSFVVFLIDNYDNIYKELKTHSLCTIGYVSQVIKVESLWKNEKNILSYCSKVLLQINSKLSGVSYMPVLDKTIKERKLMIIGVDSSHIKGETKGVTGVAMVSTINPSFTNFYNKEIIIEEDNKEQLQFCISKFIDEALEKYKNISEELPKGIIIYRQGVSLKQKAY